MKRLLNRESGQTVVVGAFAMLAVVGVLAVSFDIGAAWVQRRNLQNVADSAALAGAQSLNGGPSGHAPAEADALDYVDQHSGLSAGDAVATATDTEITVVVNKGTPRIIAGTLGLGDSSITARAKARIASQNLPGPGVVPLGVEVDDWQNQNGSNILLKDKSGSNSGLVHITGDNGDHIRDGFKFGSAHALQPTLNTEPGNKLGQATENNNSGLHVRLARALTHSRPDDNSKHCYSWDDVQPPSSGVWHCSPFEAAEGDGVQASAVVLLPIIQEEDFSDLKGNKTINVYKEGDIYMLAYFWIDGNGTYQNPASGEWDSVTTPKGMIYGRFLNDVPSQLAVFDPDDCQVADGCTIVDFDPDGIWKIVQLIE